MFVVCKKNFKFLPLLDKLLFLSLIAPPAYMLYRFVRWYLKEGNQAGNEIGNENIASSSSSSSSSESKGEPEVNG